MPHVGHELTGRRGAVRRALAGLVAFAFVLAALRLSPKPPLAERIPLSTAVYDARGGLLRLTLTEDQRIRLWVPLRDIAPELRLATLLYEDRWFRWHPGVNPVALGRAAWHSCCGGDRQGGSTLTMQLARLLWGLNTRTVAGKLRQIGFALWLEARYGKDEILEAYLNRAPYGGNVEGVGAASQLRFGKAAGRLTAQEAQALAVIPQSPTRRSSVRRGDPSLERARARLLRRLAERQPERRDEALLLGERLPARGPGGVPFRAPHLARMLLAENPGRHEIHATLDPALQHMLEGRLRDHVSRLHRVGIDNASAMLLDWTTMEVRAVVGSADFFNDAIEGQVNGTLAKRSPGSTLKPFVYALAIDQGVLHPMTMLKDAPVSFGPFSPENFDGRFVGPVSAQEALVRSRNVPAVWVASRLGRPSLYQFLKAAGIARMAGERHYGLSLVLGGGELTMEELVGLYAMLANGGTWRPLSYHREDPAHGAAPIRMLSEEASFVTLDMLQHNPRPDEAYGSRPGRVPVAWKTGTSWGFRDAWTIGVFGRYVLAVWLGNFNGDANPALVGVHAAAPLFFQIADAVAAADAHAVVPRVKPPALTRVEVCRDSGDLPNADCPLTVPTWFIPGKSPIKVSNLHRAVVVDTATGEAACPPFDPARTRREVFEYWPSDLERLFRLAGMPRRRPPADPTCPGTEGAQGAGPRITSPAGGVVYQVRSGAGQADVLMLQATADGGTRSIYWFAGTAYLGRSRSGEALPWAAAQPGRHPIRAVDEHGRSDTRDVAVELRVR